MPEPENARDRVIVRRIRNGDTYEAIGNDCGITRQRVQQIAERYDVSPLRVDEKPLSGSDLLVADLLQSEPRLSYQEVAEHTGLSQRQVRRIAEKAGLAWMRWPVYRRGVQPWDYDEEASTGCWIWRYGKSARGHGRLNVGQGQSEYAPPFRLRTAPRAHPVRYGDHPHLRQLFLRQSGTPEHGCRMAKRRDGRCIRPHWRAACQTRSRVNGGTPTTANPTPPRKGG